MLLKINRANTKEVEKVFKQGKSLNSSSLNFKFINTHTPSLAHVSFIAPKSLAKLAVQRNALRRKGYSVLRKLINQFPTGVIGVFIFKKSEGNISNLTHEIETILSKIN